MSPECETLETPKAASTPKTTFLRKAWQSYSCQDHGGDLENDLVKQYLPLVKNVVGRIAMTLPAHIHQDDLLSPGLVGLLNAIRNYDPAVSNHFEAYAKYRIRGAVLDELRRLDWVPRTIHEKAKRVERTIMELEASLKRMPEEGEIAQALEISVSDYQKLMEQIKPVTFVSIHSCQDSQEGEQPSRVHLDDDTMPGPDELASKLELIESIKEKINELPDRMKKVLAFYYYENMRLKEIAVILGVTESRVCQIHAEAILLIRGLAKDL